MSELRDKLRAQIFSAESKAPKKKAITLFGTDVEIRQPTLQQILASQSNPDRAAGVVEILINFCFVPETNEPVFGEEDRDSLLSMPFGKDFVTASEAIGELTNINLMEGESKKD
jgi:hypothetical protein